MISPSLSLSFHWLTDIFTSYAVHDVVCCQASLRISGLGWLVGWFYSITTIVGYLMPNLVYIAHIFDI